MFTVDLASANFHDASGERRACVIFRGLSEQVATADNGRGLGAPTRRSGLANMRHRATRHNGAFDISSPTSGTGTVLTWSVPYPRHRSTNAGRDVTGCESATRGRTKVLRRIAFRLCWQPVAAGKAGRVNMPGHVKPGTAAR
ncbi:hypothetical protein GCM10025762_12930 [Haloechinothrix salitolerans]